MTAKKEDICSCTGLSTIPAWTENEVEKYKKLCQKADRVVTDLNWIRAYRNKMSRKYLMVFNALFATASITALLVPKEFAGVLPLILAAYFVGGAFLWDSFILDKNAQQLGRIADAISLISSATELLKKQNVNRWEQLLYKTINQEKWLLVFTQVNLCDDKGGPLYIPRMTPMICTCGRAEKASSLNP